MKNKNIFLIIISFFLVFCFFIATATAFFFGKSLGARELLFKATEAFSEELYGLSCYQPGFNEKSLLNFIKRSMNYELREMGENQYPCPDETEL